MAKKFLTPIDLGKLEIQNAVIQNLASDPSSPSKGQFYYNTTDNKLKVYNGTSFVDASSEGGAADATTGSKGIIQLAGDLAGTAASPQIGSKVIVDGDISDTAAIVTTKISGFDTQVRTNRLDQMTTPTADVSWGSKKITTLADPTSAQDAATKAYVDATAQGLDVKASVRAATTATGTLATAYENGDTIDGITLATGDRILIKDQSTAKENGIYTVNASGAPTRATDADTSAKVTTGLFTFVSEGTVNADSGWVLTTNDAITLDTTSLAFSQFSGAGQVTAGNGLTKTGNTLDVVGTSNRISVAADSIDISSAYVGQATITTLGTITTGTWTGTSIAVANGGTGSGTASGARTNLTAAGYYSSATHGAGTTITITQATHGLRASRGLIVQPQIEASGDVVEADINVASSGDVVVTFAASQSANTVRVTIVG